jgi:type II secretion system protein G
LKNNKGFTLIELLIVILIIGIIALIAIPNLLVALQKGKQKSSMADMRTLSTAIESYNTDVFTYPPDIATTTLTSFWNKNNIIVDSWAFNFQYAVNAATQVYSLGSYGKDRTQDLFPATATFYPCTSLGNFNNDLCLSNGQFTTAPKVK